MFGYRPEDVLHQQTERLYEDRRVDPAKPREIDEELPRVFEPFYSTRFPGRGLGLAAAIGIVRGHHGVLLVESKLDQGSQFTVLIPIHT